MLEGSREVHIDVEHVGPAVCSVCGKEVPVYDHSEVRRWRHLDTMGFATFVVAQIPRGNCDEHGIKQLTVPWAEPHSRFTKAFEEWMIQVLETTRSQVRTARLTRTSANQVHDVMHRAVNRGLARRRLHQMSHLSVDEKSFQKGHKFATIVCDLVGKRVLEVAPGRDEKAAIHAFSQVPVPDEVKSVSLDMSEAFRNAAMVHFKNADVVHDRFHVAAMLGEAVDKTRKAEVRKHPELKQSRFVWLKNPENHTAKQKESFEALVKTELKTAEAYAFKQVFKQFFEQELVEEGVRFFADWYNELAKRDLPQMHKAANTFQKNIQGLLNFIKWGVTNAYAEAVNSLIQEIKTVARGFRQFENFRIAILFFLGKLELNPHDSP